MTRRPRSTPDQAKTVAFVSLGCPKNLVDSEKMLGLLAQDGIVPVSHDPDDAGFGGADAVVVNTCGFLEASKDESLEVIRQAVREKEAGHVKRVIVAGCLVQRHRAKIEEWVPGIDAMIGVFDRDHIVDAVRGVDARREERQKPAGPAYWIAGNALQAATERGLKTVGLTVNGKDGKGLGYFEDDSARLRLTPRHYAFLRISEGCNQNCAFCTIPSIRGKMRSKPPEAILAEARELIADGAVELNLIGQDTTSYGMDIGYEPGLPGLLRRLSDAASESGAWIRLMYAYPSNFSDAIIDAFAQVAGAGRLVPYIDMPLQHASDRVLGAMRRRVTRATQERVLSRLRGSVPGMAIRTTFISGFPGETDADHRELLDFVGSSRFDAMGVFEYSREDGTPAGTMEMDPSLAVPAEVKAFRRGELMALQQEIAFERNRTLASAFDPARPGESGRRVRVLIDAALGARGRKTTGASGGGRLYQGRTTGQAPMIDSVTYVQSSEPLKPGQIVDGVLTDADGYDLIASAV